MRTIARLVIVIPMNRWSSATHLATVEASASPMPSPPTLRLLPRDPSLPLPIHTAYDVSTSLARTWEPWHSGDPLPYRFDPRDPTEIDARVRDLAWIEIERLWDELDPDGTATGEVVNFSVFPPLMGRHRWRFLVSSWCPDGAAPMPGGQPRVVSGGLRQFDG